MYVISRLVFWVWFMNKNVALLDKKMQVKWIKSNLIGRYTKFAQISNADCIRDKGIYSVFKDETRIWFFFLVDSYISIIHPKFDDIKIKFRTKKHKHRQKRLFHLLFVTWYLFWIQRIFDKNIQKFILKTFIHLILLYIDFRYTKS